MMKGLSIILPLTLASMLLTGCAIFPEPNSAEQPPVVVLAPQPPSEVEQWLLTRQRLCNLPAVEQRAQLLARVSADVSREGKIERVLLASCQPDQTPGLLREALSSLDPKAEWSPGMRALLAMINDHARSYRILEDKNLQLASQLETTIKGIREIETDMNSLQGNGTAP
ncbi:MAG: hypothetical protein VR73_15490 [Gammaproteobacteria bacterium BRH_c0]|nr:MAG: hypothetical protein VR73_15490 [Gammaproteobacteria bacterium BRH_c0]